MKNEYIEVCNKLADARKQIREAHSVGFMIADIVSTIMIVVGVIVMMYGTLEYTLAHVKEARQIRDKVCNTRDQILIKLGLKEKPDYIDLGYVDEE